MDKLTGEREKNSKWEFSTCAWQARMRILRFESTHNPKRLLRVYTRERRHVFNIVNVNIRTDRNDNV